MREVLPVREERWERGNKERRASWILSRRPCAHSLLSPIIGVAMTTLTFSVILWVGGTPWYPPTHSSPPWQHLPTAVRWPRPASQPLAQSYVNNAWDHLKHGDGAHVVCNSWSSPIEKWSPIVSQTTNLHPGTWHHCLLRPSSRPGLDCLYRFFLFFLNQPFALICWNDRPHTTQTNRMPSVSLSFSTRALPSAPSPFTGVLDTAWGAVLVGGWWWGVVEGTFSARHLNKLHHLRRESEDFHQKEFYIATKHGSQNLLKGIYRQCVLLNKKRSFMQNKITDHLRHSDCCVKFYTQPPPV